MGSFSFKLLGCPLQKLLSDNIFARHLTYLAVVLFTSTFLEDGKKNPTYHFIYALIIYFFIVIFTKMTVFFTILVFILLILLYIINMYTKYFKYLSISDETENKEKYIEYINKLYKSNDLIVILILTTTAIGAIKFGISKKYQYKNKFSIIKFLFGVKKCKGK